MAHNVSSIDDGILINGRGYGGYSILWKSTLNANVTPILMHSNRVCAVQISIGLTEVIVFNVYMPFDTGANSGLYSEILQEIMAKCVELGSSNIIVGGDMNTNNTMHYCELQLFHDVIVKACVESGKQCIAHTSKSGKTSALTGWNEFVKPYRDDSIFWHNIWRQCGSPRKGGFILPTASSALSRFHAPLKCA